VDVDGTLELIVTYHYSLAVDVALAKELDSKDELKEFKQRFLFPRIASKHTKDNLYFVGNSLGLQPRTTRKYIIEELDHWASKPRCLRACSERDFDLDRAVCGHFTGERPWYCTCSLFWFLKLIRRDIDETVHKLAAQIVGAEPEVHLLYYLY
jgi:kynureninase